MISKIIYFYKKQIVKGVFWVGSVRITTRILSIARTAILARLLAPADFGAFGIALLALSAVETFTETGVNVVLIQEKKKNVDDYINTAWLVSIIRGLVIGLLIIAAAPLVSAFFKSPASLYLLIFIGLVPIIRGFINPSVIKFQKDLKFHVDFWIRTAAFLFDSLVAIIATIILMSPIGLVAGLVSGAILEVIISFVVAKPKPKLHFEKQKFAEVLHGGKWVTAFSGLDFLSTQLDNVAVGRLLNVASLGFYQMAYRISIIPITEMSDIVNKVAFPLYTRISEDRKRLFSSFIKIQAVLSAVVIPVCLLLFLFPAEIIRIILGEKWLFAAPALKVLAVYGGVRAIFGATSSLFLSLNHQKYVAVITFARLSGLLITIVPLTLKFGIVGASFSALISSLVELPVILFFLLLIFLKKDRTVI